MKSIIQIGVVAYRNAKTGKYTPSAPIYRQGTESDAQAAAKRLFDVELLIADEFLNTVIKNLDNQIKE